MTTIAVTMSTVSRTVPSTNQRVNITMSLIDCCFFFLLRCAIVHNMSLCLSYRMPCLANERVHKLQSENVCSFSYNKSHRSHLISFQHSADPILSVISRNHGKLGSVRRGCDQSQRSDKMRLLEIESDEVRWDEFKWVIRKIAPNQVT